MGDHSALHQTLRDAVKARLDLVADHAFRDRNPAAHLADLKAAAQRLDAEIAGLPSDADPTLRHYLKRQSYTKALAWLDDAIFGASN